MKLFRKRYVARFDVGEIHAMSRQCGHDRLDKLAHLSRPNWASLSRRQSVITSSG